MSKLVKHPHCKREGVDNKFCMVTNSEPNIIWVQFTPTSEVGVYVYPLVDEDRLGTQMTVHVRRNCWGSTFHTDTQHTGVFTQWVEEKPLGDDYKEVLMKEYKPPDRKRGKLIVLPAEPTPPE